MYIVEGNIGVGKSSFLQALLPYLPSLKCVPEPVDSWASQEYGKSLLGSFYENPARWAFTLETLAMICRSRDHLSVQTHKDTHLVERSIYSGHYCFALNGHDEHYFSPLEWSIYLEWVRFLFNEKCKAPKGFIYLRAEPEVCFERMQKRKRESEDTVSLSYLELIHQRHDDFLLHKKNVDQTIAHIPVLVLDCNHDFLADSLHLSKHAEKVRQFICQTSAETF